jgi:tetratricopeptide (TPR) repeat protein
MNKSPNVDNWKSVVAALVAFVLETGFLALYLVGVLPVAFFLVVHVAILVGLVFFVRMSHKLKEDLRYPLILLASMLGTGPFGLAVFLLVALLRPPLSIFTIPPEKWFEGLFPEEPATDFTKIFQRVKAGWDDYNQLGEVTSFKEIFTYGNLIQKQAVLDVIVKDYHPNYASTLLMALEDSNNAVRIQAAAIVSKIEIDYDVKLQALVAKRKDHPNDEELLLKLATHSDEYFHVGFINSLRQKELGKMALGYYQEYLQKHPRDARVCFAIGRLLFDMKEYKKFLEWFDEYKGIFRNIPDIVSAWYQQSLYMEHQFSQLSMETI